MNKSYLFLVVLLITLAVSGSVSAKQPALWNAATKGDVKEIQRLLDQGKDINEWSFGTALIAAASEGKFEAVTLLVERGADVNLSSKGGWTALGCAAQVKAVDVVNYLILHGADVNSAIAGLEKMKVAGSEAGSREAVNKCAEGIALLRQHMVVIGVDSYNRGEYQEALEAFTKAIGYNPSDSNIYDWLSLTYLSLQKPEDAIVAAKRSIQLKPDSAVAYLILGRAYGGKKQYDEAIKALKRAIELDPKMTGAYDWMGRFLIETQAYSEAAEAYKKGVEAAPSADLHSQLALAYYRMGRYDDAIAAANKAIDLQTHSGVVGISISNKDDYPGVTIVTEKGPAQKADVQVGDKILKIDGKSTKGWTEEKVTETIRGTAGTQVALTVERKGIDKPFEKIITRETIIDKSAAGGFGLRSLMHRSKGNQEGSFQDAEKAYSLDPTDAWAQLSLGASYFDRGKNDEAMKLLLQVTDSPQARILEATAYAKLGKMKEAVDVYVAIPEEAISPKNIPLMNDRVALLQLFKPLVKEHLDKARSFESQSQYKEALSEFSEALKTADETETQAIHEAMFSMVRKNPSLSEAPEEARKYVLRGEVLLEEGNLEQAATEFKKAIQIAPYVARLYSNSALLNAKLKRYPEAIRCMKIYLTAAPDAPDAGAAKDEIVKWEFAVERGKTR
jgi:tetratricopeptide (TPR) repeat protein